MLACNQPSKLSYEVGNMNFLNQLCISCTALSFPHWVRSVCMHCLWKESTEELQRKKELVSAFEFSKPSPQEGADRIQRLDNRRKRTTQNSSSELPTLGEPGVKQGWRETVGPQERGTLCPVLHLLRILVPPSPQLYGI